MSGHNGNGHGRIAVPNQVAISVEHIPAPITGAGVAVLGMPGEFKILSVGGINPLISLSATIAAGISANLDMDPEQVAKRAVAIATAIDAEARSHLAAIAGQQKQQQAEAQPAASPIIGANE